MIECSVTITCGEGSEKHNHDLSYRETLEHVHSRPNGVIELVPYEGYYYTIDQVMKPYILEYNDNVDKRYQAAWDRYNTGQIKTKPRKRDFKKLSDSYVHEHLGERYRNPHTGKVEERTLFRSIIIGIGDKDDRTSGRISEYRAIIMFKKIALQFKDRFPNFVLLGATLHTDECGFYHAHFDYLPLSKKKNSQRGLSVSTSQDAALEYMGFKPEQSIINSRDKAPILFNAFRNELYRIVESTMEENGFRMQYGVSKTKDPNKDSSKNQKLSAWQATQDAARELQHEKNIALDVLCQDLVSPEGLKSATLAVERMQYTLEDVKSSPQTILRNGYKISFGLFDQLQSVLKHLRDTVIHLIHKVERLTAEVEKLKPYKNEAFSLREKCSKLEKALFNEAIAKRDITRENSTLKRENEQMRSLMSSVYLSNNENLLDCYNDLYNKKKKSRQIER